MDYNWPAVQRNIKHTWKFWGRLGKMLLIEVADIKVSTMFYRAVFWAVVLFCS